MKQLFSLNALFIAPVFIGAFVLASKSFNTVQRTEEKHEVVVEKPVVTNKWVEDKLASMTLREKIGQFFMVAAYSNKGESHFVEIDSLVVREKIGGLIFFQGQRSNLLTAIERFQNQANIPLLIGMDAEWGVQMRLFGEERFPYNYTIGAANDPALTERLSAMMGQECKDLGIHINFAPVADVNSNPKNPVIGFRSYGEYPKDVAAHVEACVKGMENQGVLTSIKHFPGHGDTDVDSHLDLPIVNNSLAHINAIDFFPFRAGVRAGASSVMIGHLNVPALDPTGTPSSLSKVTIDKFLKEDMGFDGLIISDALGMKAVADRYGKTEVVVKAFQAGCDILLFPKSVKEAIDAIEAKVNKGEISLIEINERCRKVLAAKHKSIIRETKTERFTAGEVELAKKQLYEKALTVIKNENAVLPIKTFDKKIAHVSIGSHVEPLAASMDLVSEVDHFQYFSGTEALSRFKGDYDLIITSIHASSARPGKGMPDGWKNWLSSLKADKENVLLLFGNPLEINDNVDISKVDAIVVGYENHELLLDRAGQFIMGTFESNGHLPITVGTRFKRGTGIKVESAGRLKESQPEEVGISPAKLAQIDTIVKNSIAAGAFPGCQIVVAIDGKVIYRKAFGHHTYDGKQEVKNADLYDIASITKIAASTLSVMHLNSQGQFALDAQLKDYLPEMLAGSSYGNIRVKDMMAHQAGLTPWIPFYTKTLANHLPSPEIYTKQQDATHHREVTDNLWISDNYANTMYDEILSTPLKARQYKYSDVGYYFLKKIIEKKTGKSLDQYVMDEFYQPMGLKNISYNPLKIFPVDRIPPTENDTIFRKQLIHGYVHDQGAAMMGGVGGHAGLFSNARDLAAIMQLFLNNGSYGGVEYIKPEIVKQYTGCQFCPTNRRGAGFDKPTVNLKGGPTSNLVSLSSFGHSGFTGTLAWADPEYKVNYVFLSNRVYPDAENWKIVRMNIRTDIQRVIYEALKSAK